MTPGVANQKTAHTLWAAGGFLLFGMVIVTPWPFGTVTSDWQLVLSLEILTLIGLWIAHAFITRRISYTPDLASSCLIGLVLFTAAQLVPLPQAIAGIISPSAAEWHQSLLPEATELLPGESEGEQRPRWVRLTASPANTLDLLAALLAMFLVYAAARNFVALPAPKESLRILGWVAFGTGVALALLALLQALSGDSRVFWTYPVSGRPFGPFVNKNHFAFQLNLFMGVAGGLFVSVAHRERGWRSPTGLGLLGGLGLMATAVAISESRGGVIAALAAAAVVGIVAWLRSRGRNPESETQAGLALVLGIAVVAGILIAWLGFHTVVDRMATLWGENADNRSADWRSVWPLVERSPLTGVGGGALIWTEPTVRTRTDIAYVFNTLDNEYLEALVEGGIVRLLLTLGLGLGAIGATLRGYRRTGDPMLLGCAFGLIAVAFQSAGDFGLHTGSVSLTAAVVTAFATARGRPPVESSHSPDRAQPEHSSRRRRRHGASERARPRGEWIFTGQAVYPVTGLLLLAGFAVVLTELRAYRAITYRTAASQLLDSGAVDRRGDAIRLLETATRIRPDDPVAWELLMNAHLLTSADEHEKATAAVTGPVAFVDPAEMLPSGDPNGHIAAALRAARNARACQYLSPAAHMTLGTYSHHFTRCEPAAVHFARAKTIASHDPEVWYASGRSAANHGDWSGASADWKQSLARTRKRLPAIAWQASAHFPPDELRAAVFPNDPELWLLATPFVFGVNDDPGRALWYRAIADQWSAGPEPATLPGFISWATALDKMGDQAGVLGVWRRATDRFPEESLPRDRLADALADMELYEDAVPVLVWLIAREPEKPEHRERLAAAQHALKLKAEINGEAR